MDCLAEYACEEYGIANPTTKCAAGHYCTGGANTSQPIDLPFGDLCPPGLSFIIEFTCIIQAFKNQLHVFLSPYSLQI